jgi:hypothetical protein
VVIFAASACQAMDPVIRRTDTPIPDWQPSARVNITAVKLFEDFSDPASGWEIGEYGSSSVGYESGEYFIRCDEETSYTWGQWFQWFGDVTIEVTARQASGPENNNTGYGVMCRVQYDPDAGGLNGYAFLLSGDGWYSIASFIDGESYNLVEWTESGAIRQGSGSNSVRVICSGDHLTFHVNGVLIAETWDDTFSSGDVALYGRTFEPGATEFRFDNFSLTSP